MPKNKNVAGLTQEELDQARETFENQLEALGMNPFSKFKAYKIAKKSYKAAKTIEGHVKAEKQHYWCGVLGGTVHSTAQAYGSYAVGALTAESGPGSAFAVFLAQPAIHQGAQNLGYVAQNLCNAGVNYIIGSPKNNQKSQASTSLSQNRTKNQSSNAYNPRFIGLSGLNSFHSPSSFGGGSFKARPYSMISSSYRNQGSKSDFLTRLNVERAVREGVHNEMGSLKPNMNYAFAQVQASLHFGLGYNLSKSEFRSLASGTNLLSSYNRFNPNSKLRDVSAFCRDIGGVAGEVATITDLVNSGAHAEADNYILCMPTEQFPFDKAMVRKIQQELKDAYFIHKTSPFFSLHFNNFGYLYPVVHPAFQNTLVGMIIAILDYWMKGFLNGGAFDQTFLNLWHETLNCNEDDLKKKMFDLKNYCETNAKGLSYESLREFMNRLGLQDGEDSTNKGSAYKQPFMTSFRLIAYQESIERHDNILVPHADFRVEYSIDLMPDYKNYIESYRQEHGRYPDDYQRTHNCYVLFANEIKEKMPKLPFCQDFFRLLNLMNTTSYLYATLDKMGQRPELLPLKATTQDRVPKAFPPIPVRYFDTKPMDIQLKDVLQALETSLGGEETLNALLFESFNVPRRRVTLSQKLVNAIKTTMEMTVKNRLLAQNLNEAAATLSQTELRKFSQISILQLTHQLQAIQLTHAHLVNKSVRFLGQEGRAYLATLPLPARIQATIERLDAHTKTVIARWEENPALARTEIFDFITDDMVVVLQETNEKIKIRDHMRNLFRQIEEQIGSDIPTIIESLLVEPRKEHQVEKDKILSKINRIILNKKITASNISAHHVEIANGTAANAGMTQAIVGLHQTIATQQQQFANWYASIPANSIHLNQALIASNRAGTDANVARLNADITEMNAAIAQNREIIKHDEQLITADRNKLDRFLLDIQADFVPTFLQRIEQAINMRIIDIDSNTSGLTEKLDAYYANEIQTIVDEATAILPGQFLNDTCLKEASGQLNNIMDVEKKKLERSLNTLKNTAQLLLSINEVSDIKIAETYTYTVIGFTGEKFDSQTGEQFKIIGGCGVELPNLKTRELTNGSAFSSAIANAFGAGLEDIVELTVEGRLYTALRVSITNKLAEDETLSSEQSSLCDDFATALDTEQPLTVTEAGLRETVDASGAFLIHYIASYLGAHQTKLFLDQHPDQLHKRDQFGHLPIHAAAQANQAEVIKCLLQRDPALLDATNQRHTTPLMTAIQYGSNECVDLLLAMGANANHLLPNGLFPLMLAVQNNFTDIAISLIKNGRAISLNQKLDSDVTALHVAIENKMNETALLLVGQGAVFTIPRKSDGHTAWHAAADLGELALIQAMVAREVSIDAPLESKKTALHLAASAGHLAVVNYLIDKGASVTALTSDSETPLMLAIRAGQSQVALRLAQVSHINAVTKQGQTASLLAIQYGQVAVVDCLIERGEDPLLADSLGNSTLYYLVRNGEFHRFTSLVESHNISLDKQVHGQPLINTAAQYGHFEIVYYLLDQGCLFADSAYSPHLLHYAVMADEVGYLREQFAENTSALVKLAQLAAQSGSARCLSFLLSKLTQDQVINAELLLAAITHGHVPAVEAIIKKQGDLKRAIDPRMNTALHCATATGNSKMVALIVKSGADFLAKNVKQQTAFHVAFANKDASTFKKLLKLSLPTEWPIDLWSQDRIGLDSKLKKVLVQFEKRLPTAIAALTAPVLDDEKESPRINIETLQELLDLLNEENFDDALVFLTHPDTRIDGIIHLSEVLRLTLENSHDYSSLFQSLGVTLDEAEASWKPDRLLSFLKSNGMNPLHFTGKNNPLLSILNSSTDDEACYRLTLLANAFPECMTHLMMDKIKSGKNCAEIALMRGFKLFFDKCDELCRSSQVDETQHYHPLHQAILSDNYELALKLLDRYKSKSVDSLNESGKTPLMLAALRGNLSLVQLLILRGAKPDRCDLSQLNCLHYAIQGESETVALYLLPLMRMRGQPALKGVTPLHLAAEQGMLPVVSALCADGHALNQVDNLGRNALHYAAMQGHIKVIEFLVHQGFPINQGDCPPTEKRARQSAKRTALHHAALKAKTEAVVALLQLGADVNATDAFGNGVCEYAIMSKDTEMLHLAESLPLYHQPERESKLLHAAVSVDHPEVVSEMILADMALSSLNEFGNSVLHIAAIKNSGDAIELLLAGEDIPLNLKNSAGDAPCHLAAQYGNVRILNALLEAGADIDQKNELGSTPLTLAAENGMLGAVITLLKYEADYDLKDAKGLTAAQSALVHGHPQIACRLVLAGDQSLQTSAVEQLNIAYREAMLEKLPAFHRQVQQAENTPYLGKIGVFTTLAAHAKASTQKQEDINQLRA